MTDLERIEQYITDHASQHEEDLKTLLRIPSVSTKSDHKQYMTQCVDELRNQFHNIGIDDIRVIETPGHDAVFAQSEQRPDRPTVLFYGHYDVQPEEPLEEWKSDPFEPEIRDGKIYARGTSDDKGQFYVHLKAAEAYTKLGLDFPVNYKFIIEGEEELGSPHLYEVIKNNVDLLQCDVLVVSDTVKYSAELPGILYGMRGITYLEVDFQGCDIDLHSGIYGGTVPNPATELCKVIAKLIDDDGHITIPGFYDKVRTLSQEERDAWAALPFDDEEYRKSIGAPQLCGEKGFTTTERRWARPTFDVNGIWGGYIGEGAKTVLPASAHAKISCRLVPYQDYFECAQMLKDEILRLTPPTIRASVSLHHGGYPWITDYKHPINEAARRAYRRAWKVEPVLMCEGGSVAIVNGFCKELHCPAIMMGVGLDTDNIHAPNECLTLSDFHAGIAASAFLVHELAELKTWPKE